MNPSRPYLLRGLYEWLLDNDATPYLLVEAELPGVMVPEQFVEDGRIVLNIAPGAVQALNIDDQAVSFNARFGGVPMDVYIPLAAVAAIYSREDGQGMGFGMEPGAELYEQEEPVQDEVQQPEPDARPQGRPSLKVVK
ncbi:ClpXP protease specificity-enhancing factor [Marinobacterium jannaschii]|uniref:ClpXP protease specificity-enhancing factor n=1 Tax=Marinobacterium jannaschii TaxID=64970 RepID=UPI000480F064|nr:ClpXP protease specificity-enhancing factor [Marinobacterium jannaschii]